MILTRKDATGQMQSRGALWLLLFALCFFATLAACETKSNQCSTQDDCGDLQYCEGNTCKDRTRCSPSNAEQVCQFGEECVNRVCVPSQKPNPAKCRADFDCQSGWTCDLQSAKCIQCLDDSACAPGQRCVGEGRCVSIDAGSAEGTPSERPLPTELGSERSPQERNTPPDVSVEPPSPDGTTPPPDRATPPERSTPPPDRPLVPEPPSGCRSNNDCPSGQVCDVPSGQCQMPGCIQTGCPSGQRCNTTTKACEPIPTSGCQRNTDCGAGAMCLNSRCRPRVCSVTAPCDPGFVCEGSRCVSAMATCLSGLCAGDQRCLRNPSDDASCHDTCPIPGITCPGGGDCLAVTRTDGTKINLCVPKGTLVAGASCVPGDLSTRCLDGWCLPSSPGSSSGTCYKRCTPGASGRCSSSQFCGDIGGGRGACFTKSTSSFQLDSSCRLVGNRCNGSLICIPTSDSSSFGRCRTACTTPGSKSNCPSSYECVAAPQSDRRGVCVKTTKLSSGRTCYAFPESRCDTGFGCDIGLGLSSGLCRKRCSTSSTCASDEECREGFCRPTGSRPEGGECRIGSSVDLYHCKSGLICVTEGGGSSFSYGDCLRPCTSSAGCSGQFDVCRGGFCRESGSKQEGLSCSTSFSSSFCDKAYQCLKAGTSSSYCYRPCLRNSDCSGSYSECFGGFCARPSTRGEGQSCGESVSLRCAGAFACVKTSSFGSTTCLRPCTSDANCTGTYKKCITAPGGERACYR